jgi:hypothetical protein
MLMVAEVSVMSLQMAGVGDIRASREDGRGLGPGVSLVCFLLRFVLPSFVLLPRLITICRRRRC